MKHLKNGARGRPAGQPGQLGGPSIHPSTRPSVHPSVRPSVRSSVRPSVQPSDRLTVRPYVRASVRASVRAFVRALVSQTGYKRTTPVQLQHGLANDACGRRIFAITCYSKSHGTLRVTPNLLGAGQPRLYAACLRVRGLLYP